MKSRRAISLLPSDVYAEPDQGKCFKEPVQFPQDSYVDANHDIKRQVSVNNRGDITFRAAGSVVTVAKVKQMARRHGADFFKGKGYYYFTPPEGLAFETEGVMVYRVDEMTMEEWEDELKEKIKNAKKVDQIDSNKPIRIGGITFRAASEIAERIAKRMKAREFSYSIPSDKEEMLFDFYMLEFLDKFTPMADKSWRTYMEDAGEVQEGVDKARKSLLPYMKEELLDAVFYSITSEFRHLMDAITSDFKETFEKKGDLKFIGKFFRLFGKRRRQHGDLETARETANIVVKKMLNAEGKSQVKFVQFAEKAFNELSWESGYGGKAWGMICDGWLSLDKANAPAQLYTSIDHVFDLQHNSGVVLNKVERYSKKGGYDWIVKALDLKRGAYTPWEFFDSCSRDMKEIASYMLHQTGLGAEDVPYIKWTPKKALEEAKKVPEKDIPYIEEIVIRTPKTAYGYAQEILGGKRFPKGEAVIATSPSFAFEYAKWIIGGPWKEGESAIATNSNKALDYAVEVLRGPFPEGEAAIATNLDNTMHYVFFTKARFPKGEEVIAKDPYASSRYAKEVLQYKDVSDIIIDAIAKDDHAIFAYAKNCLMDTEELPEKRVLMEVITGRFEEDFRKTVEEKYPELKNKLYAAYNFWEKAARSRKAIAMGILRVARELLSDKGTRWEYMGERLSDPVELELPDDIDPASETTHCQHSLVPV